MSDRTREFADQHLRTFLRVAELGSLHKAAGLIGVSQPALSKQMSTLESSLGVRLFRRTTRGVTLTPQGEILFGRLQPVFDEIDTAVLELDRGTPCLQGEIVFGAIETFSFIDRIWDLVATLSKKNPLLSVGIKQFSSSVIVNKVSTGEFDFGIVHENADFPPDIQQTPLFREKLAIVFSPRHFDEAVISGYPEWPKGVSLISFDAGSALGRLVRNHNKNHGIAIRIETNSVQYLLDATARGLGVTILPEFFPIALSRDHDLARCYSPFLNTIRGNVLIQRRRGGLSPQAKALMQHVTAMFANGDQQAPR
ncbi:LysR family transcriptional regulator [Aquabacter sp. CN5-332]|uniref:LysR family transcriptional regulator n=1 Tax=Aquabacter sp. CN5-332 TaxID=3156608 RepID=UPI0032B5B8D0